MSLHRSRILLSVVAVTAALIGIVGNYYTQSSRTEESPRRDRGLATEAISVPLTVSEDKDVHLESTRPPIQLKPIISGAVSEGEVLPLPDDSASQQLIKTLTSDFVFPYSDEARSPYSERNVAERAALLEQVQRRTPPE